MELALLRTACFKGGPPALLLGPTAVRCATRTSDLSTSRKELWLHIDLPFGYQYLSTSIRPKVIHERKAPLIGAGIVIIGINGQSAGLGLCERPEHGRRLQPVFLDQVVFFSTRSAHGDPFPKNGGWGTVGAKWQEIEAPLWERCGASCRQCPRRPTLDKLAWFF